MAAYLGCVEQSLKDNPESGCEICRIHNYANPSGLDKRLSMIPWVAFSNPGLCYEMPLAFFRTQDSNTPILQYSSSSLHLKQDLTLLKQ